MEKNGYRKLLRNKNYMLYITANVINRFGDALDSIAFTWIIYSLTGNAFWSALIFGINRLPTIFLQPFFGVIADKVNKKVVIISTDIIRGLCVLFIAVGLVQGYLNEWMLVIVMFIISVAEAFRMPAASSLMPQLLEVEDYEYGVALNEGLSSTMELVGMLSVGLIIGLFGVQAAVFIDMATFFICALLFSFIQLKPIERTGNQKITYIADLKEGLQLIKNNNFLLYMIVLAVFLNALTTPFNALQAPLVKEVLMANEMMLTVIGVGFVLGGIVGSFLFPKMNKKFGNLSMVKAGAMSLILMYLCPVFAGHFIDSLLLRYLFVFMYVFIVGVCIALLSTLIGVFMVKAVKPEYLGRVKAILGALSVASTPLVAFMVSGLVKGYSTEIIFIGTGICCILCYATLCNKKVYNKMVGDDQNANEH